MRIIFGFLAASVFVAGAATAQLSPVLSPDQPVGTATPSCVSCYNPTNSEEGCVANYGVTCGPNEEFDHCTSEQAAAWCPGWSGVPPTVKPTCAICHDGEASPDFCWADYGASCNPPTSTPPDPAINHCTDAQAAAWCAGWTQRMQSLNPTAPPDL
jgi:hypothetical protein